MQRIEPPVEKAWRTITYQPQPLSTRTSDYQALAYWQSVYGPETQVVIREDTDKAERDNFMGHLRRDIPILVIPDPDKRESYVEPLATIHKAFWELASTVIWTRYPLRYTKGVGRSSRMKWGSPVHSLLADVYWAVADWRAYTPDTWVEQLNRYFEIVEQNDVRSDADLVELRRLLTENTDHKQSAPHTEAQTHPGV